MLDPGGAGRFVFGFGIAAAALNTGALDRLFAYGTLMTGFSRRPLLGGALLEARGRIRGTLLDLGEYPGVLLDSGGWVVGELYRVPDMVKRLSGLDRAEGFDPADEATSPFVRRRVAVLVGDGSTREAWVYVYNDRGGPAGPPPRIASGDWRAHVTKRGALPR